MIRICGWCKRSMGTAPGPADQVTHGLCDGCLKGRVLYERRVLKLRKMLNDDEVPKLVIANQCWLVLVAYRGGKWKTLFWILKRVLINLPIKWAWIRGRFVKRATEESE